MQIKNVPQDHISTYAKNKKAVYATDENGDYKVVASSGWDVEGDVTQQALNALQQQAAIAYEQVKSGRYSPLYYHMYAQRMDLSVLAQSTGFFQWRVKRHFSPQRFTKLSNKLLNIYSDALGLTPAELKVLPKELL